MQDIEWHANEAWGPGKECIAAYDFLRVNVPFSTYSLPLPWRVQNDNL